MSKISTANKSTMKDWDGAERQSEAPSILWVWYLKSNSSCCSSKHFTVWSITCQSHRQPINNHLKLQRWRLDIETALSLSLPFSLFHAHTCTLCRKSSNFFSMFLWLSVSMFSCWTCNDCTWKGEVEKDRERDREGEKEKDTQRETGKQRQRDRGERKGEVEREKEREREKEILKLD